MCIFYSDSLVSIDKVGALVEFIFSVDSASFIHLEKEEFAHHVTHLCEVLRICWNTSSDHIKSSRAYEKLSVALGPEAASVLGTIVVDACAVIEANLAQINDLNENDNGILNYSLHIFECCYLLLLNAFTSAAFEAAGGLASLSRIMLHSFSFPNEIQVCLVDCFSSAVRHINLAREYFLSTTDTPLQNLTQQDQQQQQSVYKIILTLVGNAAEGSSMAEAGASFLNWCAVLDASDRLRSFCAGLIADGIGESGGTSLSILTEAADTASWRLSTYKTSSSSLRRGLVGIPGVEYDTDEITTEKEESDNRMERMRSASIVAMQASGQIHAYIDVFVSALSIVSSAAASHQTAKHAAADNATRQTSIESGVSQYALLAIIQQLRLPACLSIVESLSLILADLSITIDWEAESDNVDSTMLLDASRAVSISFKKLFFGIINATAGFRSGIDSVLCTQIKACRVLFENIFDHHSTDQAAVALALGAAPASKGARVIQLVPQLRRCQALSECFGVDMNVSSFPSLKGALSPPAVAQVASFFTVSVAGNMLLMAKVGEWTERLLRAFCSLRRALVIVNAKGSIQSPQPLQPSSNADSDSAELAAMNLMKHVVEAVENLVSYAHGGVAAQEVLAMVLNTRKYIDGEEIAGVSVITLLAYAQTVDDKISIKISSTTSSPNATHRSTDVVKNIVGVVDTLSPLFTDVGIDLCVAVDSGDYLTCIRTLLRTCIVTETNARTILKSCLQRSSIGGLRLDEDAGFGGHVVQTAMSLIGELAHNPKKNSCSEDDDDDNETSFLSRFASFYRLREADAVLNEMNKFLTVGKDDPSMEQESTSEKLESRFYSLRLALDHLKRLLVQKDESIKRLLPGVISKSIRVMGLCVSESSDSYLQAQSQFPQLAVLSCAEAAIELVSFALAATSGSNSENSGLEGLLPSLIDVVSFAVSMDNFDCTGPGHVARRIVFLVSEILVMYRRRLAETSPQFLSERDGDDDFTAHSPSAMTDVIHLIITPRTMKSSEYMLGVINVLLCLLPTPGSYRPPITSLFPAHNEDLDENDFTSHRYRQVLSDNVNSLEWEAIMCSDSKKGEGDSELRKSNIWGRYTSNDSGIDLLCRDMQESQFSVVSVVLASFVSSSPAVHKAGRSVANRLIALGSRVGMVVSRSLTVTLRRFISYSLDTSTDGDNGDGSGGFYEAEAWTKDRSTGLHDVVCRMLIFIADMSLSSVAAACLSASGLLDAIDLTLRTSEEPQVIALALQVLENVLTSLSKAESYLQTRITSNNSSSSSAAQHDAFLDILGISNLTEFVLVDTTKGLIMKSLKSKISSLISAIGQQILVPRLPTVCTSVHDCVDCSIVFAQVSYLLPLLSRDTLVAVVAALTASNAKIELLAVKVWVAFEDAYQLLIEASEARKGMISSLSDSSSSSKSRRDSHGHGHSVDSINEQESVKRQRRRLAVLCEQAVASAHTQLAIASVALKNIIDAAIVACSPSNSAPQPTSAAPPISATTLAKCLRSSIADPKKVVTRYQRSYTMWIAQHYSHSVSSSGSSVSSRSAHAARKGQQEMDHRLDIDDKQSLCETLLPSALYTGLPSIVRDERDKDFEARHAVVAASLKALVESVGLAAKIIAAQGRGAAGSSASATSESSIRYPVIDLVRPFSIGINSLQETDTCTESLPSEWTTWARNLDESYEILDLLYSGSFLSPELDIAQQLQQQRGETREGACSSLFGDRVGGEGGSDADVMQKFVRSSSLFGSGYFYLQSVSVRGDKDHRDKQHHKSRGGSGGDQSRRGRVFTEFVRVDGGGGKDSTTPANSVAESSSIGDDVVAALVAILKRQQDEKKRKRDAEEATVSTRQKASRFEASKPPAPPMPPPRPTASMIPPAPMPMPIGDGRLYLPGQEHFPGHFLPPVFLAQPQQQQQQQQQHLAHINPSPPYPHPFQPSFDGHHHSSSNNNNNNRDKNNNGAGEVSHAMDPPHFHHQSTLQQYPHHKHNQDHGGPPGPGQWPGGGGRGPKPRGQGPRGLGPALPPRPPPHVLHFGEPFPQPGAAGTSQGIPQGRGGVYPAPSQQRFGFPPPPAPRMYPQLQQHHHTVISAATGPPLAAPINNSHNGDGTAGGMTRSRASRFT